MRRRLDASGDAVWTLISNGGEVERWFSWVAQTVLVDAGEGGLRVIRMRDGTSFDEYITVNDEGTRTYQYYAPDPPLLAKHVIGTQRVETSSSGGTFLVWSVTFDLTFGAPNDFTQTMRALYEGASSQIDALARAL
ncbi:MAG: SRPBCC family protein [Myxococcales bacterium]